MCKIARGIRFLGWQLIFTHFCYGRNFTAMKKCNTQPIMNFTDNFGSYRQNHVLRMLCSRIPPQSLRYRTEDGHLCWEPTFSVMRPQQATFNSSMLQMSFTLLWLAGTLLLLDVTASSAYMHSDSVNERNFLISWITTSLWWQTLQYGL
jgi:hypothetical protein